MGFKRCQSAPCVFVKREIIVGTYVDDFFVTGKPSEVARFKAEIGETVKIKDLGPVRSFLSVQFFRPEPDVIMLCQGNYIGEILQDFSMKDCKTVNSPLQLGANFESRTGETTDKGRYESAVRCIGYLSNCTRPDISNATCRLGQFSANPTVDNWRGVQHVLRYLKGTQHYALKFKKGEGFASYCD